MDSPSISIIIPCKNEEKYLAACLDSIISNDYPLELMEILVIDGKSNDKTVDVIKNYENKYSNVKFFENEKMTVPYAMNIGINNAKGDFIIRIDAHSVYPQNYIFTLISWIKKLNADNVGGVWDTIAANDSLIAQSIAKSTSNQFGIGNAQYRLASGREPFRVDTVPFGCYRKEIFNKIGLFDVHLTRNQDDELNARLIQSGGSIFLIPDLKIKYVARENYPKMCRMFYQYGYFKPLVNLKLNHPSTIRQFVPLLFVLFIILGGIFSLIYSVLMFWYLMILSIYFIANIGVSFFISVANKNLKLLPYLVLSFTLIHMSYGFGYIKGILDFILLKKHITKSLNEISVSR